MEFYVKPAVDGYSILGQNMIENKFTPQGTGSFLPQPVTILSHNNLKAKNSVHTDNDSSGVFFFFLVRRIVDGMAECH